MTRILRIDASSRKAYSFSRQLADQFVSDWLAREPDAEVVVRDLVDAPVPHLAEATIEGYHATREQMTARLKSATALSDQLIAELRGCNVIIIATPMYNFTIPSALKAWIDQIVRIGHTFAYDGKSFSGLLQGKRAIILTSSGAGGFAHGGRLAAADFVQPYLKFLLNFLGITDVTCVLLEATRDDAAVATNHAKATDLIRHTIARVAPVRAASSGGVRCGVDYQ